MQTVQPSVIVRRSWPLIAVLAVTGACASFMFTLVVPIQAQLPELLNAPRGATAWVVTITLLTSAVVTPIAGRLGDLYGKRKIILVLLVALVIGNILAAVSTGLSMLLVGRALQGLMSGVIPLGIAVLRDHLPAKRVGGAVALISGSFGFGAALGLPISAFIAETLDWHALFWTGAAMGVVLLFLVALIVPKDAEFAVGSFDYVGAAGLSAGLSGILVAVAQGNAWGWASPATLATGAGGIVLLLAWGAFELRLKDPVVDLRVAARPAVLMTNLASVALGFAFFSSQVLFPQLLQLPTGTGVGLGQTLISIGLILAPAGVVQVAMAPVAARLNRTVGGRATMVVSVIVIGFAYALALLASSEIWQILVANALVGAGIGIGYASMPLLIMGAVEPTETGAANGLNSLMRSLGTSSAAAVMGAVLAASSVGHQAPTAAGFQLGYVIALGATVAAGVLALCIPRPRRQAAHMVVLSEPDFELDADAPQR
ncbi:MFS transporter [Arthrobacter sp. SDTb3-6]|uniref:MFS transporter n=1 Tax=Arthrobacter sp. SDTb3-6 TaxID=2713571 RepID=UPI00159DCC1E|nr:MFS transporter [Arthrobacter sp. SDTb3-6]NVM99046.1 MFS transporter [Arthrobacter sp. SDTb3-6]